MLDRYKRVGLLKVQYFSPATTRSCDLALVPLFRTLHYIFQDQIAAKADVPDLALSQPFPFAWSTLGSLSYSVVHSEVNWLRRIKIENKLSVNLS
jgi:hypothetical protein